MSHTQLLTFQMNEVVWMMNQHADSMLKKHYGVSFSWFLCMVKLQPIQPTTQHNLARHLQYSDAAVSRLVAKISAAGLIRTKPDPTHARKHLVSLTKRGENMVDRATIKLEKDFQKLAVWKTEDSRKYLRLTQKIRDCLGKKVGGEILSVKKKK